MSAAHPSEARGGAPAGEDVPALYRYVLRLGDLALVLGQRLSEWVGHAPALEEDLGLANIALDLVGQARLLLAYAGEIEGRGRGEDDIAFLRTHGEYLNPTLVEQPNGDFGETIVRQVLIDAFQLALYERLASSRDERLAAIAEKAVKETRYHLRYSSSWLVRLAALADPTVKLAVPELDKFKNASNEKARRVLGWKPHTSEDSIVATAESLIKLGLV